MIKLHYQIQIKTGTKERPSWEPKTCYNLSGPAISRASKYPAGRVRVMETADFKTGRQVWPVKHDDIIPFVDPQVVAHAEAAEAAGGVVTEVALE